MTKLFVPPTGNLKDPEAIVILPYPEGEELETGKMLSGLRGRVLRDVLGERFDRCCFTSLVKSCDFKDKYINSGQVAKPTKTVFDSSRSQIWEELETYSARTVIPLGKECIKLISDDEFKVDDVVGSFKDITKGKQTYRFIPNYDPVAISRDSKKLSSFRQYIDKALAPNGI